MCDTYRRRREQLLPFWYLSPAGKTVITLCVDCFLKMELIFFFLFFSPHTGWDEDKEARRNERDCRDLRTWAGVEQRDGTQSWKAAGARQRQNQRQRGVTCVPPQTHGEQEAVAQSQWVMKYTNLPQVKYHAQQYYQYIIVYLIMFHFCRFSHLLFMLQ